MFFRLGWRDPEVKKLMKIAQVAPLSESVPPRTYGGTERVVHYLTEALVRLGHEVTLYASADSLTSARLKPVISEALRLSAIRRDPTIWHLIELAQVDREAEQYDIVHFHMEFFQFPLIRYWRIPSLTTLHGRLDLPDLPPFYSEYRHAPLVSISNEQRRPIPGVNWVSTVYHGLPVDLYDFNAEPGNYLVFLGRVSPEKGPETAIEIARRAGMRLKIAAKVDTVDQLYFESRVRPLLAHPLIEFVGEVDEPGKNTLLGSARALLFPIDWPEPFGLVMIEAMACGTPVIAYRRGSVPEVMNNGVSGFIVDTVEEAVQAVKQVDCIDRKTCRRYFETRFSAERMAGNYLAVYQQLLENKSNLFTGSERDTATNATP